MHFSFCTLCFQGFMPFLFMLSSDSKLFSRGSIIDIFFNLYNMNFCYQLSVFSKVFSFLTRNKHEINWFSSAPTFPFHRHKNRKLALRGLDYSSPTKNLKTLPVLGWQSWFQKKRECFCSKSVPCTDNPTIQSHHEPRNEPSPARTSLAFSLATI